MKTYTSWILIGALVILIIGGMVWYSSMPGEYDDFAACITNNEAKFYGAFWCPHCQEQKALFGRSAKRLPYIECSTPDGKGQLPVCLDQKVEVYPTWVFKDGTKKTGAVALADLATFTSCPLVKN